MIGILQLYQGALSPFLIVKIKSKMGLLGVKSHLKTP